MYIRHPPATGGRLGKFLDLNPRFIDVGVVVNLPANVDRTSVPPPATVDTLSNWLRLNHRLLRRHVTIRSRSKHPRHNKQEQEFHSFSVSSKNPRISVISTAVKATTKVIVAQSAKVSRANARRYLIIVLTALSSQIVARN